MKGRKLKKNGDSTALRQNYKKFHVSLDKNHAHQNTYDFTIKTDFNSQKSLTQSRFKNIDYHKFLLNEKNTQSSISQEIALGNSFLSETHKDFPISNKSNCCGSLKSVSPNDKRMIIFENENNFDKYELLVDKTIIRKQQTTSSWDSTTLTSLEFEQTFKKDNYSQVSSTFVPNWSGFYKLPLNSRKIYVASAFPHIFSKNKKYPKTPNFFNGLDEFVADKMVENCIGTVGLPFGIALNLVVDGSAIVVPMAVEEPSVIAAVSGAAKTLCSRSVLGITTTSPPKNLVSAQILLSGFDNVNNTRDCFDLLESKKAVILLEANKHCMGMVKRGGGVIDMELRIFKKTRADPLTENFLEKHWHLSNQHRDQNWLVVQLVIDVCDSMGANCASSVAEKTSLLLSKISGKRASIKIVSNFAEKRVTRANFRISVSNLDYKNFSGAEVAARIVEAYLWARDDVYRSATHNKGVMNGIDAIAIATGQDWRAIEAACHSWAAGKPLTRYWMEKTLQTKTNFKKDGIINDSDDDLWFLCGEIEAPVVVGTFGGVLSSAVQYKQALGLMGNPNSSRLAAIMCSVGLCQNFAALRALVTEGIQRGHMCLHAQNLAITAGANLKQVSIVAQLMIDRGEVSVESARSLMNMSTSL